MGLQGENWWSWSCREIQSQIGGTRIQPKTGSRLRWDVLPSPENGIVVALWTQHNLELDMTTTLLNGVLIEEEVFMRQPRGYTKPEEEHLVWKLSSQDPESRSCGTATVPVSCGERLMYLSVCTLTDLALICGWDSCKILEQANWMAAKKRVLRYQKGTVNHGIAFTSLSQESAWDILMQTGLGTRKTGNPHLVPYSRWLQNQCHGRVESRTVLPEAEYIKFNWSTAPLVTWWSTC